jgi:hypothetical protein
VIQTWKKKLYPLVSNHIFLFFPICFDWFKKLWMWNLKLYEWYLKWKNIISTYTYLYFYLFIYLFCLNLTFSPPSLAQFKLILVIFETLNVPKKGIQNPFNVQRLLTNVKKIITLYLQRFFTYLSTLPY